MMNDLARVAEDFGPLRLVRLSEYQPGWIEAVHLEFQSGHLVLEVDRNNDTIRWDVGPPFGESGETPAAWVPMLSSDVRWIWLLTNHRGFQDGIQIEFALDERTTDIQIMAEASRLWVYRLEAATSRM
jgi:hypothetical protein